MAVLAERLLKGSSENNRNANRVNMSHLIASCISNIIDGYLYQRQGGIKLKDGLLAYDFLRIGECGFCAHPQFPPHSTEDH